MQIGIIGLGKMGSGIAQRLSEAGHHVIGYDSDPAIEGEAKLGIFQRAGSISDLIHALPPPRAVWMMVPAGGPVDATIEALRDHVGKGAVLVDGGNSYYKDTVRRAAELEARGVTLLDVGTSGGVWGRRNGFSLMIGGDVQAVARLGSLFEALAPSPDRGWGRVGPVGSGHYVKMIHNGIEYGLMQAYAEGFALLKRKEEFDLDPAAIAGIWGNGSVIRSWLLDLSKQVLEEDPDLTRVSPQVQDSGEGRWTVQEALDLDVAAPVITLSLISRLQSREGDAFTHRLLTALRDEFGGHGRGH